MLTTKQLQGINNYINSSQIPMKYYAEWLIERVNKQDANLNDEVVREIADAAGVIPLGHNIYDRFLEEIISAHGIDNRHIIEVGGGALPQLAKRISLKQKNGTIKVYDPRLLEVLPENDRLVLKKEPFYSDTPLGCADLLVGLMPCQGAESLLDAALKNRTDFIVWTCEGGPHGEPIDYFEDEFEWLHSLICSAKRGVEEQKMGKLMIKEDKRYSRHPIIFNQR